MTKASPVIQQYLDLKAHHPNHLLLFQMGDFYELFFEDAVLAANALDITLTKRGTYDGQEIPMCGVPLHASDAYLGRLIRQGFSVALCEQLELPDPKIKGPLKRGVVRILTPGTLTEDPLLEPKAHHLILCVVSHGRGSSPQTFGLAGIDLSTGAFWTEAAEVSFAESQMPHWGVKEAVFPEALLETPMIRDLKEHTRCALTPLPSSRFHPDNSRKRLEAFYQVTTLEAFALTTEGERTAAGALLDYVLLTQKDTPPSLSRPVSLKQDQFLRMDPFTRKSLEITETLSGDKGGSLLTGVDRTLTSPGGRLLSRYLQSPLLDVDQINDRLDGVAFLTERPERIEAVRGSLKGCPDPERACSRLLLQRGGPRDLGALRDVLGRLPSLRGLLEEDTVPPLLQKIRAALGLDTRPFQPFCEGLKDEATHRLPSTPKDGGFVAPGVCPELDEARDLSTSASHWLKALEEQYGADTGIGSLKIKENNLIGAYIEVSPSHLSKVPPTFTLKQSLVSGARYTTPDLLALQEKRALSGARARARERALFEEWCTSVRTYGEALRTLGRALALLDVLAALADLAVLRGYVRPLVDNSQAFHIEDGRHPVVEQACRHFIPNTCHLEDGSPSTQGFAWLLTGPNMAGKSTFLRQNALLVILAQMGSFVPARQAHIGVCDRLFSRVGANDHLSRGASTFMVEMVETATILTQATARSFVILDEIGRGTSTHDGLALAWACLESLVTQTHCRTLFATHYHELTALEGRLPGVACYTPSITEWEDDLVFLHKIIPGTASGSFGLHVARLAGVPSAVVQRARDLQKTFGSDLRASAPPPQAPPPTTVSPLEAHLKSLDLETLSPKDALNLLYTFQEALRS